MAINVNTVYTTVLSILNKEQRGYLTPYEFNQLATQVQLEIFEKFFEDYNQYTRMPKTDVEFASRMEHIRNEFQVFEETKQAQRAQSPNIYTQPGASGVLSTTITGAGDQYVDGEALTYSINGEGEGCVVDVVQQNSSVVKITILDAGSNYNIGERVGIVGGDNLAEFTVNKLTTGIYRLGSASWTVGNNSPAIEILSNRDYNEIKLSPLTQPTNDFPIAKYKGNDLIVFPETGKNPERSDVLFNYIRKPKDVVWAYGVGAAGQYIWSEVYAGEGPITPATGSQDFEISDSQQTEVILNILKYAGVVIRDPQIVDSASRQIAANDMNSKK